MDDYLYLNEATRSGEKLTESNILKNKNETFWFERLTRLQSLYLPYETAPEQAEQNAPKWATSLWHGPLQYSGVRGEKWTALGAFAIYLARLMGLSRFQIGWRRVNTATQSTMASLWASVLPMEFEVLWESPFANVVKQIVEEVEQLALHKSFLSDMASRHPVLREIYELRASRPWRIGVAMVDDPNDQEAIGALLTLQIDPQGRFRWIYDEQRLDAENIERMSEHLRILTRSADVDKSLPVARLNLLSEVEDTLLFKTWNAAETSYQTHQCIHHLFEEQAARSPEATALVLEDKALTYSELNAKANRLAHRLIDLGVGPDQRVAICVERSPSMVVGLMAILKAGGAYVPLDPAYPGERLAYILADAVPVLVLADAAGRRALGGALQAYTVLDPNETPAGEGTESETNPRVRSLTPRNLAYIIYTSGSTGQPKGVMVEHAQVVRLFDTTHPTYRFEASDVWCLFHSFAFDFSVWELWGALRYGSKLVLVPHAVARSPQAFYQLVCEQGVTVLNQTPSAFKALIEYMQPSTDRLRYVIFGGEALQPASLRDWYAVRGASAPQLVNMYGITETTVHVTYYALASSDIQHARSVIGKRLPDLTIYLLDAYGQPVPLGAVGEMYIGGAGVARGYLNRPELTAERFLPDPFAGKPDARMFKSGDLARYLPDGNLVFVGRNDDQVKIRGFRIEPGEIAARLAEHPSIREAVVVAQGAGTDKRLVAYVVPQPETPGNDVSTSKAAGSEVGLALAGTLRDYLSARLPDYMVPSAFVRLESLPLTLNGKLDQRALPTPEEDDFVHAAYEAPQGEIETTLAALWSELLGVERVGRHDNFFALGGHSLMAVRLVSRIASSGVELPFATLFASPTLKTLALAIEVQRNAGAVVRAPINTISRDAPLPLSFAQQRLWFLAQLDSGISEAYHIPLALRLRGQLNVTALQQALNTLWGRHEALRSVFVDIKGEPKVHLLAPGQGLPLRRIHLPDRQYKGWDSLAELARLCEEEARAPFDLAKGPLIRACLVRLGSPQSPTSSADEHVFLLTQHHIISDGWSLGILLPELSALYTAYSKGQPSPLPPITIQYPDYAAWQRQWLSGARLEEQAAYWKQTLADAPILLDLPTDRERPEQQSFVGASVAIELDGELTTTLKRLSQQYGVTLFMTLLTAWAVVLSRLSGQEDIVIGAPSANRGHREIEPLIGFFVNTLALRVDLSDNPSVADLLALVRDRALKAQDHQDLPFEQVVEIVQPPRRLSHTPLFQVVFAWQNYDAGEWTLPDLEVCPVRSDYNVAKFDLELSLAEADDRVVGALGYATALFDATTIERQVGYLKTVLAEMIRYPRQAVSAIDLLDRSERTLLLKTWNVPDVSHPAHLCIHHLFEEQAARSPEATALVLEDKALTYSELNAKANRLAHRLIDLGVGPDQRVAICVERSPAMVVGLMAILKAGGAYVPLDPAYPGERLAYILADAVPVLVLADAAGRRALGGALQAYTVLDPNETPAGEGTESETNPWVRSLTPRNLAYIIYTSGSTGQPKGVMVEHAQVVRLFDTTHPTYRFEASDVWCLFHSFAFDFSVWELWGALRYGSKLVLVPHAVARSPQAFYQLVCEQGVTVLNQTPSAFKALIEYMQPSTDRLRYVIFGGEALQPASLRDWYAVRGASAPQLVNMYGITETTVHVTYYALASSDIQHARSVIGKRLPDLTIYLLDAYGQPVPLGAVGEMYIGGAGVARGYLNRPELTAERFLPDPFAGKPDARMFKSGDLARYLPDGNLVFVGRNDDQVKIRGFRIEPGEIAARLAEHPSIREAVVVAQGAGTDKRLVAYVVPQPETPGNDVSTSKAAGSEVGLALAGTLRDYLSACLPDYMVPSAFVRLENLPHTPNGKLDRRALPAPEEEDFAHAAYEAPQGKNETLMAALWSELLGVERVGRHDNFFALGGHSLMGVQLIEQLRRLDLSLAVRDLFRTPVLSALASTLDLHREVVVPPNLIGPDTVQITPELLPLIELSQAEIDRIASQVSGGVANIQDIYALSPLQDGILFHHLLAKEGDPYLLIAQMAFVDRTTLDRYLGAVQRVVDRNDILRTAFVWEGLSSPAQVVWRKAPLSVIELILNPADGPVIEQLSQRFDPRRHRIDLTQAPVLQFVVVHDPIEERFILLQLRHHLIDDASSLQLFYREVQAFFANRGEMLPSPEPFRNLIAQARLGTSVDEHERFFKTMLGEVDEPTLPFGLAEVHRDGAQVSEAHRMVSTELNDRLRAQARRLNVSLASLCHVAFAQVLARTSGQEHVVFGTVLFGRMQAGQGADRAMGLFINTLPIRFDIGGIGTAQSVQQAHARLAELLAHEHASLALAQRCSGVAAGMPLFSALLNYRHNDLSAEGNVDQIMDQMTGIEFLGEQERTNYPFTMSVDDFGHALELTTQVVTSLEPDRVCCYMERALESLAETLAHSPDRPVQLLDILPVSERTLLLKTWNAAEASYPGHLCIHHLFEEQVVRSPEATALIFEDATLSYGELNAKANQLAHRLIDLGVGPDQRVAICVARSPAMVVGLMAILKAGGAYVPLDPAYPGERLAYILADAAPALVLADTAGRKVLGETLLAHTVLDPNETRSRAVVESGINPQVCSLTPRNLAYIIYTSGSTGQPKGVMVEHRGLIASTLARTYVYKTKCDARFLLLSSMAFDSSVAGIFGTLTTGGALCLPNSKAAVDPNIISNLLIENKITSVLLVPSLARLVLPQVAQHGYGQLRQVIVAGELCPAKLIREATSASTSVELFNEYGPTETTVWATVHHCISDELDPVPIGRPILNTRIYLLDAYGQPVPLGAVGEMYIGGVGVARGYLNRPELTAERFVPDPFAGKPDARMFKTGDLARYLPNGNVVFVGRNDDQVKIRGFRIEPDEIAVRLVEHPSVHEAVVVVQGADTDKRLVAYIVTQPDVSVNEVSTSAGLTIAGVLRDYLSERLPDYMVPSAFVRMESLPLTPNGKLDRRTLPTPVGEDFAHAAYEAPQGEIETTLAALWSGLLGVERVGRHDNFFALGGHSLMALQLMQRVRNCGFDCSLNEIFKHPRLANFALQIAQAPLGPHTGAIPVRQGGTEPPIFFVPSGLGDYSYVISLAQYLRVSCPIYVLPWSAIGEPSPPTLETMAERMLPVIQTIQPNGPYRIAGYSSGGILAYAIAHSLMDKDAYVEFLGFIDVPAPRNLTYKNQNIKLDFIAHAKAMASEVDRHKLDILIRDSEDTEFEELIKKAQGLGGYDSNADILLDTAKWRAIYHFAQLAGGYKPIRLPIQIPLYQFYAADRENVNLPPIDMVGGWKNTLPDLNIHSVSIPGGHLTMMTDINHRKHLAEAFNRALLQLKGD
jgi:amino acid adenylation domain-containing protein